MNPVNAIVGPVEMKLLPSGDLQMYIPRCWMHTAPGDGQTQDQTCLWACKGACEQVFGPQSIAPMVSTLIEGLSTALYTTLVGAVLNVWLMVNYRLLAGGTVKLITALVEFGEDHGGT